jgi:GTP-binding protein YchF
MSLKIAIVGLPNVGKSTLFNALLKKQQALAANYPFATIEPNVGVVAVPDHRLQFLAETIAEPNSKIQISISNYQFAHNESWPPIVSATIEFVDVAGLVAGASQGEGLGNQFLAHIRECDAVCHVLRLFEDGDVVLTGKMEPLEDLKTVRMELRLKDMETVERAQSSKRKAQSQSEKLRTEKVLELLLTLLEEERSISREMFGEWEWEEVVGPLHLLSVKPEIFVVNVSEAKIQDSGFLLQEFADKLGIEDTDLVVVSAKVEAELASLTEEEQIEYLGELGLEESGIERLAKAAYTKLGLISFLTAGEKECRAWTIRAGQTAVAAAGVIHTDFMKKFIKADVISFDDFVTLGGWKKAREVGRVRSEGRDYLVQDGEVVEFKIGG